MTALDCLADQARWTAWRNELGPTGKPTKISYTPLWILRIPSRTFPEYF